MQVDAPSHDHLLHEVWERCCFFFLFFFPSLAFSGLRCHGHQEPFYQLELTPCRCSSQISIPLSSRLPIVPANTVVADCQLILPLFVYVLREFVAVSRKKVCQQAAAKNLLTADFKIRKKKGKKPI